MAQEKFPENLLPYVKQKEIDYSKLADLGLSAEDVSKIALGRIAARGEGDKMVGLVADYDDNGKFLQHRVVPRENPYINAFKTELQSGKGTGKNPESPAQQKSTPKKPETKEWEDIENKHIKDRIFTVNVYNLNRRDANGNILENKLQLGESVELTGMESYSIYKEILFVEVKGNPNFWVAKEYLLPPYRSEGKVPQTPTQTLTPAPTPAPTPTPANPQTQNTKLLKPPRAIDSAIKTPPPLPPTISPQTKSGTPEASADTQKPPSTQISVAPAESKATDTAAPTQKWKNPNIPPPAPSIQTADASNNNRPVIDTTKPINDNL